MTLVGMLVTEYAPEESEYNKNFLYTEVLISLSNYISTHFLHLLFIFGFTFISAIFFFNRANDLKHYSFFKKRFLKKNKSLISTLLGHYNLTIDDVNIDYKNLEISYKLHNLSDSKNRS